MSNISQFDVATAALEHLELLNHSNQNPLEIAAQFRTLLRLKKSKKNEHSSNIDYTYMDYRTTDATIRRRGYFHNLTDHRSKSLNRIQCKEYQSVPESHSSYYLLKCEDINSSTEDVSPDSGISSHSIDQNNSIILPKTSNRLQYPTTNWKQLREKQYKSKFQEFISKKFKIKDLTIRKNLEENNLSSRSRSSSASIRTPPISPINSPRPTYTISKLNSTLINHNNDDILFPIADCNLVIKHKPSKIPHLKNFSNPNKLFRGNMKETFYI